MNRIKPMQKQNMYVSTKNPLINQILDSKQIKGRVYITYNICETCNLNCLFCCIDDKFHGKKFVSIDNSDKILNKINEKFGIDTIFIMANEPTTQPNLSNHIIKYAVSHNIKIKIVSNGYASKTIYKQTLNGINPKDIDKITISLDSMEENIHNKLRNNNNSYQHAIEIIKFLRENNYNIRIQMTICDINYDSIINSVKQLNQNYGIKNFAFHCMSISNRANNNGLDHINPFKWRKLVKQLLELKKSLNDIEEYSVPIIAMTENELLKLYFGGNKKILDNFISGLPTKMCPAINGNNLYIKANDDNVYISRCQILFDTENVYSYNFDYKENDLKEEINKNDYEFINECKSLCPAIKNEINSNIDFCEDENGVKLYYVCRVLLANESDLDF